MTKMLRHLNRGRIALLAVALFGVSACGGDSATAPTSASISGTWNLQTINGSGLPFIASQSGTDKAEILGDVLTVSDDGSFTELTSIRLTSGSTVTNDSEPDAGNYSINGTAVSFTFQSDGSTATGTVSGNTLTIAEAGVSLVYKKQ